jgi:hypothetical protein
MRAPFQMPMIMPETSHDSEQSYGAARGSFFDGQRRVDWPMMLNGGREHSPRRGLDWHMSNRELTPSRRGTCGSTKLSEVIAPLVDKLTPPCCRTTATPIRLFPAQYYVQLKQLISR